MIRDFNIKDIHQLTDIYNYYVLNTIITFDHIPYSKEDYQEKITRIASEFPCIIFEENNEIVGYAYASKWRAKPAYNFTVESTVYLNHSAKRNGIGTKLYAELLKRLKEQNYHTVIGGISLPNAPSIKFHEKFGFKKAAHFKEVGLKFGKWIDVAFWQLDLQTTSN